MDKWLSKPRVRKIGVRPQSVQQFIYFPFLPHSHFPSLVPYFYFYNSYSRLKETVYAVVVYKNRQQFFTPTHSWQKAPGGRAHSPLYHYTFSSTFSLLIPSCFHTLFLYLFSHTLSFQPPLTLTLFSLFSISLSLSFFTLFFFTFSLSSFHYFFISVPVKYALTFPLSFTNCFSYSSHQLSFTPSHTHFLFLNLNPMNVTLIVVSEKNLRSHIIYWVVNITF
jgi:hypothetical protein